MPKYISLNYSILVHCFCWWHSKDRSRLRDKGVRSSFHVITSRSVVIFDVRLARGMKRGLGVMRVDLQIYQTFSAEYELISLQIVIFWPYECTGFRESYFYFNVLTCNFIVFSRHSGIIYCIWNRIELIFITTATKFKQFIRWSHLRLSAALGVCMKPLFRRAISVLIFRSLVGFIHTPDAADSPRRLHRIYFPRKLQIIHHTIYAHSYTYNVRKCFFFFFCRRQE
jgi:hypothetical protein